MEFLAKVADTFQIQGRGLVLVPEKPETDFLIRVGTKLELRSPDGRAIKTHITGVEFLKTRLGQGSCRVAFPITRDIAKDDAPAGTEIWYLREDASDVRSPSNAL